MFALRTNPRLGWFAAGVAVIAAFFIVGIVAHAVAPSPSGPALSSYATSPEGVAGWAELLTRDGHEVRQLRTAADDSRIPSDATLVILSSDTSLSASNVGALRRFLNRGGRVILGGGLADVAARLPGAVVAVTNPGFLENHALASGHNAFRSLALVGSPERPVYFYEAVHGYGPATGLAALPERWWFAIGGLGLALVAWALSRTARLGGSDPIPTPSPSPRAAYVDAMGLTLLRAANQAELSRELSEAAARESAFRSMPTTMGGG